ncbi:MAG TPA: Gfo/Idh/MocA family oxidoreductase [Bacteroidales bacterium]|nr:Gfo/Idh/MocA family oxidoreductase [Bacteroidales bacterium]HPT20417.1 Gfo/Idh/MocA family oxidoreductase [Bacteroidales bacterium]
MKNFGIIGVAGYIAVRHLKAIKETGNNLLASLDKFDSVGRIDSFFPESDFFVEFERFDRHFDKLKRNGTKIDYVSICSPNYLHDSHIRFALRHQAEAICEKPIVLNPWNVDALQEIEKETGRKINTVLQLRLHPKIKELKERIANGPKDKIYDIDMTYITSRGNWYAISWKGDIQKSGGVATNIGIHFFDMLSWIFGDVKKNIVHVSEPNKTAGYLELKNARIRWFLSLDYNDIPPSVKEQGKRTYRSITVDGEEVEFSEGFTELHTETYKEILAGRGFGLQDARQSVEIAYTIRNAKPSGLIGDYHPMLKNKL